METLLVDTTVWVNYLNGISDNKTDLLHESIRLDRTVCITPTILQEILQGIRYDDQFEKVKNSLLGFNVLIWEPVPAAIQAAKLYRNLRSKGITIRKSNDCLIAAFALHFDLPLLHADKDFERIRKYYPLLVL